MSRRRQSESSRTFNPKRTRIAATKKRIAMSTPVLGRLLGEVPDVVEPVDDAKLGSSVAVDPATVIGYVIVRVPLPAFGPVTTM